MIRNQHGTWPDYMDILKEVTCPACQHVFPAENNWGSGYVLRGDTGGINYYYICPKCGDKFDRIEMEWVK